MTFRMSFVICACVGVEYTLIQQNDRLSTEAFYIKVLRMPMLVQDNHFIPLGIIVIYKLGSLQSFQNSLK
jgi:hypothetical protein